MIDLLKMRSHPSDDVSPSVKQAPTYHGELFKTVLDLGARIQGSPPCCILTLLRTDPCSCAKCAVPAPNADLNVGGTIRYVLWTLQGHEGRRLLDLGSSHPQLLDEIRGAAVALLGGLMG
jgi:hypothetical protein